VTASDEALRQFRASGYETPRADVQELVPLRARRILDLGCASGALGAALKARQDATVVGVEMDEVYAESARRRIDRVVVADLDQLDSTTQLNELGRFDCVIAADVLEHLRDPWSVFAAATDLLGDGGVAVVSLPNVRYWQTFWELGRRGSWPLHDAGVFDRSHLRWFTLHDAVALLRQAGVRVTTVSPQYRLKPSEWRTEPQGRWFRRTPLAPFFVYQYVLAGIKTFG
jgi:methionine biosynthesis protein MetW